MRRADRLLRITDILRGGRLTTAQDLADRLEVSKRTIYRDVADLIANRVPIEGEAGMGYVMRQGYDLPPIMFTAEEVVALVGGARLIRAWGGGRMGRSAEAALDKIAAVLPDPEAARAGSVHIHAFRPSEQSRETADRLDGIEAATEAGCYLSFAYSDERGRPTRRTVRPLGLWFWGKVWTMVAWCELRQDFRMFRVDRMSEMNAGERFPPDPDRTIEAFRRSQPCLPPEW
ncbi:helix-turn-helix transcriptional regulator [Jannaschia aquimarina]|uniref:HTH domain protein n=1 Tax=Jannaschia aquimarina TaxID=935700 RepID=A0A0D1DAR4_9RHOB|nr:YafY family protein [Jannaschia aquimarina]KIT17033.1 HTH domain protein [Jannaschia aquimarina]SNS81912.1 Predicted DNA-binding transcriptional regulator YafY, contains an HTH and WYL domains [Jannaschia aquimarina]